MLLLEESVGPWIDGASRRGRGPALVLVNPSLGEAVGQLSSASEEDAEDAVLASREAFEDGRWRTIPALSRQRILASVGDLIRRHDRELARAAAEDMGMPEGAARFIEVPMAASVFDYYAGLIPQIGGVTRPVDVPGAPPEYLAYTLQEPVGVVGLITPWNFPLLIPAWKLAPALAAGCSVVLKPAPEAPRLALMLARLVEEAGVPPGVVNVIPGGDSLGRLLVGHPGVDKISLTGETETGRRVLSDAAATIKRVSLELGGKSPAVVFADADLDLAVSQCLFGIYFNSGQVCQAGSRILVEQARYAEFLDRFIARAEALKVGPATDPSVDMGPMVRQDRLERAAGLVASAAAAGARVLAGGQPLAGPGFFLPPTVVADVEPAMALAQEEVFGPVAAVLPFTDDEDAVRLANSTIYGLSAAVFTRDLKRALSTAHRLTAGTVWVNTSLVLSPTLPFGGVRASGLGRELGEEGLRSFLETKTVIVDLNQDPLTYF